MANWHLGRSGQQFGPYDEAQMRRMAASGELLPQDLLWCEGMPNWLPASQVLEFAAAFPPSAPPMMPQPIAYAAPRSHAPPPNHLVGAILVTLFCCLPFGIVSIVYAAQVNSRVQMGDFRGALAASTSAKTWYYISLWCGLIFTGLWFIIFSPR